MAFMKTTVLQLSASALSGTLYQSNWIDISQWSTVSGQSICYDGVNGTGSFYVTSVDKKDVGSGSNIEPFYESSKLLFQVLLPDGNWSGSLINPINDKWGIWETSIDTAISGNTGTGSAITVLTFK